MIRITGRFAPSQTMKLPKPAPLAPPVPWWGHGGEIAVRDSPAPTITRRELEARADAQPTKATVRSGGAVPESELDRRLLALHRRGLSFAKIKETLNFEFRNELRGEWMTGADCKRRLERMLAGTKRAPNERIVGGARVPIPRPSNDGDNGS